MDRVEFIEQLQGMIDSTKDTKDKLTNLKCEYYYKSKEYLRDQLKDKSNETITVSADYRAITGGGFSLRYDDSQEKERPTTTRQIIELGYELKQLELECEKLDEEIVKYKNDSAEELIKTILEPIK